MFQCLWAFILVSVESDCAQLAALGMQHFTIQALGLFSPGRLGPAKDLSSRKTQILTVRQGGWTLLPSYTNDGVAKDNYHALCFQSHICFGVVVCKSDAKTKFVSKLITDSRVASLPE